MSDRLDEIRTQFDAGAIPEGWESIEWLLDEIDRLGSIVEDLARSPTPAMPDPDFGAICRMCDCDNLHPDSGTVDVALPGTTLLAAFTAKHHRRCPWVRAREEFPEADELDDR